MRERYKTIGLPEGEYQRLSREKARFEAHTGKRVDWGNFLLLVGGLWAFSELAKNGEEPKGTTAALSQREKPVISLTPKELDMLTKAKESYQQSQGKEVDFGQFLLILAGLWALHEVTKE